MRFVHWLALFGTCCALVPLPALGKDRPATADADEQPLSIVRRVYEDYRKQPE